MKRSSIQQAEEGLSPLKWAHIAMSSASAEEARQHLISALSSIVHVNSLLVVVGATLPHAYRQGQGQETLNATRQQVAGVLVSEDWTQFLQAGNFQNDPLARRLGTTLRPMF